MNGGESQHAASGVREGVWDSGRTDDDVAGCHHGLLITELERGFAGVNNEHLNVGMAVKFRTTSRWRVHQDEREGNVAVRGTNEVVGVVGVGQGVERHNGCAGVVGVCGVHVNLL